MCKVRLKLERSLKVDILHKDPVTSRKQFTALHVNRSHSQSTTSNTASYYEQQLAHWIWTDKSKRQLMYRIVKKIWSKLSSTTRPPWNEMEGTVLMTLLKQSRKTKITILKQKSWKDNSEQSQLMGPLTDSPVWSQTSGLTAAWVGLFNNLVRRSTYNFLSLLISKDLKVNHSTHKGTFYSISLVS